MRDGMKGRGDFSERPSGIFLQGGLDDPNQLNRLAKLVFARKSYAAETSVMIAIGQRF
jgi:hypothetical protein